MNKHRQKACVLFLAVANIVVLGCGQSAVRDEDESSLKPAIAYFIDGNYSDAERELIHQTGRLKHDSDLRVAYLYLGRTYMALGDYQRAEQSLRLASFHGGGVQVEGYLSQIQHHLQTSPRSVRLLAAVTRGQLAALIYNQFLVDADQRPAPAGAGVTDWSAGYATAVENAGFMRRLPDDDFHHDRYVTKAAFFVVAKRVANWLSVTDGAMQLGRYSDALGTTGKTDSFVTGEEVSSILQRLADERSQ